MLFLSSLLNRTQTDVVFTEILIINFQQLPFASECDLSRSGQSELQMQTGVANHMMYNSASGLNLANINNMLLNNSSGADQNESEVEFIGDDRKIEVCYYFFH